MLYTEKRSARNDRRNSRSLQSEKGHIERPSLKYSFFNHLMNQSALSVFHRVDSLRRTVMTFFAQFGLRRIVCIKIVLMTYD